MIKHFNFTIRGRVHGVGFRFSCMETAYRYGITGIVKNQDDGSVYIEAEGEEGDLEIFRKWCSKGPLWAKVLSVSEEEGDVTGYSSFDIVR
jgi:acylphosphatase